VGADAEREEPTSRLRRLLLRLRRLRLRRDAYAAAAASDAAYSAAAAYSDDAAYSDAASSSAYAAAYAASAAYGRQSLAQSAVIVRRIVPCPRMPLRARQKGTQP